MLYEILSDIGKKRTINEDGAAVFVLPEGITLAVIADGMGGHRGGDFASATTIKIIGEKFMDIEVSQLKEDEDWSEWLKEAIYHVNRLLYNYAENNEELKGMGTTLEVVLIRGRSCLVSHIGDSRVYKISNDKVKQVTTDHSYVNVLIDSGEITEAEAANHPQRNWIIKALGSERTIDPDFYTLQLDESSYLLICTDGLSNEISEQMIQEIVLSDKNLSEKAKMLVEQANNMGGEDNISVILLKPSETEAEVQ